MEMTMCVTSKRHRIDDQDAGAYYFLVKREKTHKSDNESEVCSLEEGHRAVTSPTPPPFAVIARGFPLIIGTMTMRSGVYCAINQSTGKPASVKK